MARMTGGEAIVDSLVRHGIDTVFGLPGVQTYGLFDAFARASNQLRLINARHEQTTAYMALGYACATGRPAAYAVVPGPGVLNTTAAMFIDVDMAPAGPSLGRALKRMMPWLFGQPGDPGSPRKRRKMTVTASPRSTSPSAFASPRQKDGRAR